MFDNLYRDDKEKAKEGYYEIRSHNDKEKQYCSYCNDYREFSFDRCTTCKNQ